MSLRHRLFTSTAAMLMAAAVLSPVALPTLAQVDEPSDLPALDIVVPVDGYGAESIDGSMLLDVLFNTADAEDPCYKYREQRFNMYHTNYNIGAVLNGPTMPSTFNFPAATRLQRIETYHWNGGRGATPGKITLRGPQGELGPWQTVGIPAGPNGALTYHEVCLIDPTLRPQGLVVPAGTYTLIDSGQATWSHNAQSGNAGFIKIHAFRGTNETI